MEAQQHSRQTVVVGVDGSRSALRAVQWAAAESVRRKLPLRVVSALEWQEGRAHGRFGADYRQIVRGEAALAFALDAASARGVPLIAVHTWSDLVANPQIAPLVDWDAVEADEQAVLAEQLAGWGEKYPDVRVHRRVIRDRAAHALVEESRRAQLVVVGSRGRSAAAGLLLGSVSRAVLHRSYCSVAIVRPPGEGKP